MNVAQMRDLQKAIEGMSEAKEALITYAKRIDVLRSKAEPVFSDIEALGKNMSVEITYESMAEYADAMRKYSVIAQEYSEIVEAYGELMQSIYGFATIAIETAVETVQS
jgi:lysyl-tRNA synthetase class II